MIIMIKVSKEVGLCVDTYTYIHIYINCLLTKVICLNPDLSHIQHIWVQAQAWPWFLMCSGAWWGRQRGLLLPRACTEPAHPEQHKCTQESSTGCSMCVLHCPLQWCQSSAHFLAYSITQYTSSLCFWDPQPA